MNVLVVTPWFPTDSSPVNGVFHLRDVELLALDHFVTVLHLDENTDQTIKTISHNTNGNPFLIIRVPYTLWNPLKVFKARRVIKDLLKGVDALHTMSGPAIIPFFGFKVPTKWIHTEHWSAFVRPACSWREKISLDLIKFIYNRPQAVVAVSNFLSVAIQRYRKNRVEVIGNFVPENIAAPRGKQPNSPLRIIGVGSVVEQKGPHLAVEAIAHLTKEGIATELVWFGDGPLTSYCQKLAADLRISNKVRFSGIVQNEQIQFELSQSDVFIAPTETETFGVAIAEAMMNGLPVITGDCGGFLDFIQPASSRVVSERTGAAFADAIIDLLGSKQLPSREDIANFARSQFDESKRRAKYNSLYGAMK